MQSTIIMQFKSFEDNESFKSWQESYTGDKSLIISQVFPVIRDSVDPLGRPPVVGILCVYFESDNRVQPE